MQLWEVRLLGKVVAVFFEKPNDVDVPQVDFEGSETNSAAGTTLPDRLRQLPQGEGENDEQTDGWFGPDEQVARAKKAQGLQLLG